MKEYRLKRGEITYEITKEDKNDLKKEKRTLRTYIRAPSNSKWLSDNWKEKEGSEIKSGNIYRDYYTEDKKTFQSFIQFQAGDEWSKKSEDREFKTCNNPFFKKTNKIKSIVTPSSYLSKNQKIFLFTTLICLSALLIGITILTAGASIGIILPSALGFLNAISAITGIAIASLATSSVFTALTSIAVGSALLAAVSVMSAARIGSLGYKEKFINLPGKNLHKHEDIYEIGDHSNEENSSEDSNQFVASQREKRTIFEDIVKNRHHFFLMSQNFCCPTQSGHSDNERLHQKSL